ncbi:LysR family transcriptional regulator [Oenococcus kitaharae]|uniref:LysR family transcriptional regulator n=1 Tax=Oenococcus kitaharae DSM 17330 TaxID=1045004 RepID=G9WJH0_9LACO|nr:LysR family transcriptional regulator [Oenococcus kitaharae]EHN59015.1 LysR family transcriptional regulator [Oenococcus kitaharae DSM 17330]OEY84215.1 transcriptional regulator [Oenococcus kitaharae]OEY84789.1 transcriptional regulator [Oenococcus kitaharae]OEY85731.1 transcriptional regulator [Oenococcus kitaharae]
MKRLLALQKVIELRSFSKAALALGYTQSAVSHMVAALEDEFSIKLLYRSHAGIQLTLEGTQVYPLIQNAIRQYQAMQEKVQEIKGLSSGTIRIGTISSISAHWLPVLIQKFQEKYPQVKFILHQGDYTTIPEWVRTNQADFGFISPDALPNTAVQFVKSGALRAVLPLNHPLAQRKFVTLTDLVSEPFLELEEGSYSEPISAFKAANLDPHVKIRIHDDYSILSMIELGLGVSILPELVLQKTAYQVAILPVQPELTRKIGIISQKSAMLPIASQFFIDFIMENVDILP